MAPRFKLTRNQTLIKQVLKYANMAWENHEMACLSLPTALSSRVTVKNCFIICYHPGESENTKSY